MLLRHTFFSTLCVAALLNCTLRAADLRTDVDKIVTPFLKDKPFAAVVVGITAPKGRQLFGYGKVELGGKSRSPDDTTIFEIGSITKLYTGTLLAQQVLTGRMRLDDSVQKYLPKDWHVPRRDDRDITLLHLSTHTSELPVQPPDIVRFAKASKNPADPYGEYGPADLRHTLGKLELKRPIGSRFVYSNLGTGLLGHALAHTAKKDNYEDLLIDRIVGPLKMSDTRIKLSEEQRQRLAIGHTLQGNRTSNWTFASLQGAGGLRSTAADQLVFIEAALGLRKNHLAEALRLAQQPWRATGRPREVVGLNWFQQQLSDQRFMLWHNGGTGGYRSFLGLIPQTKVGVIVLSNSAHSVDALAQKVLLLIDEFESQTN